LWFGDTEAGYFTNDWRFSWTVTALPISSTAKNSSLLLIGKSGSWNRWKMPFPKKKKKKKKKERL
jgi:hypothetical protein